MLHIHSRKREATVERHPQSKSKKARISQIRNSGDSTKPSGISQLF